MIRWYMAKEDDQWNQVYGLLYAIFMPKLCIQEAKTHPPQMSLEYC